LIKFLKWDSEFFGFKIGSIEFRNNFDFCYLHDVLKSSGDYKCFYLYSDNPITEENLRLLSIDRYLLADIKLTYQKTLENIINSDFSSISEYSFEYDINQLYELGIQSGHTSRFCIDPLFNPYFEDMYKLWVDNSVSKKIADRVFIYKNFDLRPIGMVTCKIKDEIGQIGLIATDSHIRGKGIGTALLKRVENYYQTNSIKISHIITQKGNIQACSFYEKNGYRVIEKKFIYHLWKTQGQ